MPQNPNAEAYFSMLKKPKKTEALLQKHLCLWMKMEYATMEILFRGGMEGFHLSMVDAQYATIINSHTGFPDMMLFEPRKGFVGLAIELKTEEAPLYKKDGTLCKNEHLKSQQDMLERLRARGWKAEFAQGFEQAKSIIQTYLSP